MPPPHTPFETISMAVPDGLPALDDASQAHGLRVRRMLCEAIQAAGGWLDFEQWMRAALYAPGLGYYSAGSTKFDRAGDFITAPELTPLFGQTVARQVTQVLRVSASTQVLEFGAGTGALAQAVIPALQAAGLDVAYAILEPSAELRARQQARLAPFGARVRWLDTLPTGFVGCVLANEVLDAMPVTLFRWNESGAPEQLGVVVDAAAANPAEAPFCWQARLASAALADTLQARLTPQPGYQSEINRQAEAWVRDLGRWLTRGAALLIDYGFPQHEYYHPQRRQGTLMCHFRHHSHTAALALAGLQDITAHVDFTAMADAALDGGLAVLGYCSQARFLTNAGLLDLLAQTPEDTDGAARMRRMQTLNLLLSEAEMGELFKVLAVGRGIDEPLLGFTRGDRRDRLAAL